MFSAAIKWSCKNILCQFIYWWVTLVPADNRFITLIKLYSVRLLRSFYKQREELDEASRPDAT